MKKSILISLLVTVSSFGAAADSAPTSAPVAGKATASPAAKFNYESAVKAVGALRLTGNLGAAEDRARQAVAAATAAKDDRAKIVVLCLLADCLDAQDKFGDEEAPRREALALAIKTFGANSAQNAEQLGNLAGWLARKGDTGQSWTVIDQANTMLGSGASEAHPLEAAACYMATARVQVAEKSLGLADDSMKKALELRESKLDKNDPLLLGTCAEYAQLLEALKRTDEASKLKERITLAKALATTGSAGTPAVAGVKTPAGAGVFGKLVEQAKKAAAASDRDQSLTNWKLAVAEAEKHDAKDGRLAYALVHLGDEYSYKKQYEEATAVYKRAMDLREKANAGSTMGAARNLSRISSMAMMNKEYGEAAALLGRAAAIEQKCNASPAMCAETLQRLVSAYMVTKDNGRGEQACKDLISLAESHPQDVPAFKKASAQAMLGSIYMQTGRMNAGMEVMKKVQAEGAMTGDAGKKYAENAMKEFMAIEKQYDDAEEAAFVN